MVGHFYWLLSPPSPVSATTAALLPCCFTLPYLCKHVCVADGCFVCVLALELFPPRSACPFFLGGEREKTWEDVESDHPCLIPPALEEPLSCLLLVQLGSCGAAGMQEEQIQQHPCPPAHSGLCSEAVLVGPHC